LHRKLLLSPKIRVAPQRRSALLHLYERHAKMTSLVAVAPLLASVGPSAPVQAIGMSVLPSAAMGALLALCAAPPTQTVSVRTSLSPRPGYSAARA
jgi:hypothetical protein